MTKSRRVAVCAVIVSGLAVASLSTAQASSSPDLSVQLVATYDTGLAANGAEIISVRDHDGVAALTNVAGSIDVLDVSDPSNISLARRVSVSQFGVPNSVAVHPSKDFLLVAHGAAGSVGTVSAWRISDGAFLASAGAGLQPDSVAISPNGRWALVANEAEGTGRNLNGGEGSLSLIDLAAFNPGRPGVSLTVEQIPLPSAAGVPGMSTGRTDDIARLAVTNTAPTLEPESVTFDKGNTVAYVSLQENNGIAVLDIQSRSVSYIGLGATTHAADLLVDNAYLPTPGLSFLREPDGIALIDGGRYLVTADEGDTRDGAGSSGPRGGRTVSVIDLSTRSVVGDTGSALDDATAAEGVYPDGRSNRGGSEPEGIASARFKGHELVVVGLERGNAVALIDVNTPTMPRVLSVTASGVGPEGVAFLERRGKLWVLAANEVSGTVSVFSIG